MFSLFDTLNLVAEARNVLGLGAATITIASSLSVLGVAPKVVLVRALTVGWRSVLRSVNPISVREKELNRLSIALNTRDDPSSYLVVTGDKGFGKSCLVDTLLHRRKGVIMVEVSAVQCSWQP